MRIDISNIEKYKDKEVILLDDGIGVPIKFLDIKDGWIRYLNLSTRSIISVLPDTELKIYTKKDETRR